MESDSRSNSPYMNMERLGDGLEMRRESIVGTIGRIPSLGTEIRSLWTSTSFLQRAAIRVWDIYFTAVTSIVKSGTADFCQGLE